MTKRVRGFTLIEMLIVICVIALLMGLLVVGINVFIDRARFAKTKALVEMLNSSCEAYRTDFGVYPQSPGGGPVAPSATSSSVLHLRLGSPVYVNTAYSSTGGDVASTTTKPPYIEFKKDHLPTAATTVAPTPPQPIVDAWVNPIWYGNPGTNHAPTGGNHTQSVDIFSKGKDQMDPEDDVTNWVRDY